MRECVRNSKSNSVASLLNSHSLSINCSHSLLYSLQVYVKEWMWPQVWKSLEYLSYTLHYSEPSCYYWTNIYIYIYKMSQQQDAWKLLNVKEQLWTTGVHIFQRCSLCFSVLHWSCYSFIAGIGLWLQSCYINYRATQPLFC
jgi:hypothetical protein